ncbi:HU family DNA-binding protein [Mycoplasmopsis gallinarum]|uniref:DNA-binding histone like protein HU n=1 Tax=Mycoplasmopsis gallinarum TaxID=29557 RepID=A0A168RLD8_9BACT|nr:HU family DNA-binding protein [Mycoplasmopsis gallinarum]OAB49090.1 DNA-binding histone like protein HU [Mycoplasmopsis gallinarum]
MTKKEFISQVAEQMSNKLEKQVSIKEAEMFFDAFVFVLKEEMIAENKVQLSNLGTFETIIRKGRKTVNPFKKNEELIVPEKRVVRFKPSKYLRDIVNF